MPLQLRDNLHWCDCGGRAIFLDLAADRYFCLSHSANQAFRRLAGARGMPIDPEELRSLLTRGLLVDCTREDQIVPPPRIEVPTCDFPDSGFRRISALSVLCAIVSELYLSFALRTKPLMAVLDTARAARRFRARVPSRGRLVTRKIVAASSVAALITRSHDRCLVRSLSVYSMCRKNGVRAKLVFGVVDHPFAAHSWVQLGSEVLVGGHEQVRLYTPIFVLE